MPCLSLSNNRQGRILALEQHFVSLNLDLYNKVYETWESQRLSPAESAERYLEPPTGRLLSNMPLPSILKISISLLEASPGVCADSSWRREERSPRTQAFSFPTATYIWLLQSLISSKLSLMHDRSSNCRSASTAPRWRSLYRLTALDLATVSRRVDQSAITGACEGKLTNQSSSGVMYHQSRKLGLVPLTTRRPKLFLPLALARKNLAQSVRDRGCVFVFCDLDRTGSPWPHSASIFEARDGWQARTGRFLISI